MTRFTILGAAIIGLLLTGAPAPATAQEDCAPDGDVQFICGPVSPEDFAQVPDSPWVIVPNMVNNGPIQAVDTRGQQRGHHLPGHGRRAAWTRRRTAPAPVR